MRILYDVLNTYCTKIVEYIKDEVSRTQSTSPTSDIRATNKKRTVPLEINNGGEMDVEQKSFKSNYQ